MNKQIVNCIILIAVGLLSANNAYSESYWEKIKREAGKQYKKAEEVTKKTVDDLVTSDEKEQKSENTSADSSNLNQDKNSVTSAQINLNKLGLYEGTADGIYGGNTRRAISEFENIEGMTQTGDVTQVLLTKLETAVSQGKFYGAESKPHVTQTGNQQTNKGGNIIIGTAALGTRSYDEIEVEANKQPLLTRKMLVEALDGNMTVKAAAAHLQARGYASLGYGKCNYRRTTQESKDTVTLGTDKGTPCKDDGTTLNRVTKIIIPTSGKVDFPVYKLRLHKAMGGVGQISPTGQYAWNNPATMPDIKRFHVALNNNPSGIREMAEFKEYSGEVSTASETQTTTGSSQKTVQQSNNQQTNTNAAKSDSNQTTTAPWKYTLFTRVPGLLMVYRFNPELVSKDALLRDAKYQIRIDQDHYKSPTDKNYIPMFAEHEVADRNPEFAAQELIDTYIARIKNYAAKIPSKFTGALELQLEYDHNKQVLHTKFDKSLLLNMFNLGVNYKVTSANRGKWKGKPIFSSRIVSGVGGSLDLQLKAVYGEGPYLDTHAPSKYPRSIGNYQEAKSPSFSFDRIPAPGALPMSSKQAERLFTPPKRPPKGFDAEAKKKEKEYYEKVKRYSKSFILLTDFEVKSIEKVNNGFMVHAKILGAELLGTRKESLKTYAASDFTSVDNMLAQQQKNQQSASQEKEQQKEKQAAQKLEKLQELDILGIKLGMPMKQAEKLLAKQMKFETVYSIAGAKVTTVSRNPKPSQIYKPYSKGKVFAKSDGSNVVAVFIDDNHQVIGVSRRLESKTLKKDALRSSLEKKYGAPDRGDRKRSVWGSLGKSYSCHGGSNFTSLQLTLVSGSQVQNIGYKGAGLDTYNEVTSEALSGCAPVLEVRYSSLKSSGGGHAEFRLYDHSEMAAGLKALEGEREQENKANEEELVL